MKRIKCSNIFIAVFVIVAMCMSNIFDVYGKGSKPSSWAVEEINEAEKIDIIPSSFTWDYQDDTTRAEFCEITINALSYIYGCKISDFISFKGLTMKEPFSDAPFIYVTQAYTLGIVSGVGGNKFSPFSKITREQAATMINNILTLFNYTPDITGVNFSDSNDMADYAVEGIKKCAAMGVMVGSGGKFNPKGSYTHEQSIASIYRLCKILKQEREKNLFTEEELAKIKEINERLGSIKKNYQNIYAENPDTTYPYNIGKLNEDFLKESLDYINFARYMAGLPEVSLSEDLNRKAQCGVFVLNITNQFTHYPKNTANLPEELFSIGADACASSNLGYGHGSLYEFNRSCMDDTDPYNIAMLGHRRWLLSPYVLNVGMGYINHIASTYVFPSVEDYYEARKNLTQLDTIKWPSEGLFPLSEFNVNTAWSVCLCDNYTADDNTEVKMVRKSDGKTWILSKDSVKSGREYFNISYEGGYGFTGECIIFRPDEIVYLSGEEYTVTITGLYNNLNKPHTLEYSVKFF